jgi:hypothetical protein
VKAALLLGAALWLVQSSSGGLENGPTHLRYERELRLPAGSTGDQACAVLDADVFAHMAGRTVDDLRVYREGSGSAREGSGTAVETPFTLMESEAEPTEPQAAIVQDAAAHGDTLDFSAVATVTGSDGQGSPAQPLGEFTLFDLTREHLARSTELTLQESRLPLLHVSLRLHGVTPTTAMIRGALVPPSREAQTLYTVVSETSDFRLEGTATVAHFTLPEHVPVERVRLILPPGFHGEFLRTLWLAADSKTSPSENVSGEIWAVNRPAGSSGSPALHAARLSLEAVLAANLRSPARVTVALKNNGQPPLPLRAMVLEMRQRTLCFPVIDGQRYTLRYGDAGLRAPVYTQTALSATSTTISATLGPELSNPAYVARPLLWHLNQRRPELYWLGLLAAITLAGTLALHRARHEREKD